MSQSELLKLVAATLEDLDIGYMLTGSMASSMQGEPRLSHDVDFVVDLSYEHGKRLVARFASPDFYLDAGAITEAVQYESMFNLLHIPTGDKVDFWILKKDAFSLSAFKRRLAYSFLGSRVITSSPEDTIISKLKWAKLSGGSSKQISDIVGILEVNAPKLDYDYLNSWVLELDLGEHWRLAQERAGQM
jgi:hypothetical protein